MLWIVSEHHHYYNRNWSSLYIYWSLQILPTTMRKQVILAVIDLSSKVQMADKDCSLGWIIIIYNVYCTFLLSKNICLKCTCKLYCIWITQLVAPCATFQQYFDTAFKSFKEQALRPAGPPYNCKITVFILTYNLLIWFVNWVICTILQWKLDGRKHQNQIFLVSVLLKLKSDTIDR